MAKPRTVIVTGATAGVGRAVARRFGCAGDRIGLIARDATALEEVQSELAAFGVEVACESADVANADEIFAAAAKLEDKLGPFDVWVNDAMETVFSTVAEISPAEFHRVTEVTYLGFVYGTMAALKSMRPRGRGIVQMGSALAYRGIPLQSAYLRRQARDPRIHRQLAGRVVRRAVAHFRVDRGVAGGQYAAIRLGARAYSANAEADGAAGRAGGGR